MRLSEPGCPGFATTPDPCRPAHWRRGVEASEARGVRAECKGGTVRKPADPLLHLTTQYQNLLSLEC
jgi:hypothetical protein